MQISAKVLSAIVVISLVAGGIVTKKIEKKPAEKPAEKPVPATNIFKKKKKKVMVAEDIILPNGQIGKKVTTSEEEVSSNKSVTPPNPTALFGYTINYNVREFEFETKRISHSVFVGKVILKEYVDGLYGVVGADLDNKLMVQQVKAGIIKTN